jgi:hypothetical protein
MCPACLTTAALIAAAGAASTGGLTAVVMRTLRGKRDAEIASLRSEQGSGPCSASELSPATSGSLPAAIS